MAKAIYSKNTEKYIPALAEALKKIPEFKAPEWVSFVKSGTSKQRIPANPDFWYLRAASILRQLYIKGVLGVGRLRTRYGSRKDRGGAPGEFRKSGGKIIRTILKQAEEAGLVEKILRLQHGRRLTQKGRDFLDSIDVEEEKGLDFSSLGVKGRKAEEQEDYEEITDRAGEEYSREDEE